MPFPTDPNVTCFRSGGVTWYRRNGVWVMRSSKNAAGNASKSAGQDATRRRWRNVQNLWTSFSLCGWMPRYQEKLPGKNNYNCFTALALQGINIYLTETEAKNYAAILLPLTISDGTLPTIGTEFDGVGVRSDISVGSLTVGPDTKVCELALAIMKNNHGFLKGDMITFVAGQQEVWQPFGHPHVCFHHCTLPIDPYDERPLSLLPGSEEAFCVRDGFVASTVADGACTWVHERQVGIGKAAAVYYSKQTMWCRNEEMITRYSDQAALEAAMESYNGLRPY